VVTTTVKRINQYLVRREKIKCAVTAYVQEKRKGLRGRRTKERREVREREEVGWKEKAR
jgi:hypothetical protein